MDEKLSTLKNMVRSIIISGAKDIPVKDLQREYREFTGEQINYREYGHPTLESLLRSIPDTVRLSNAGGLLVCNSVSCEDTRRIESLIERQRKKKKSKPKVRGGPPHFASRSHSSRGGFSHGSSYHPSFRATETHTSGFLYGKPAYNNFSAMGYKSSYPSQYNRDYSRPSRNQYELAPRFKNTEYTEQFHESSRSTEQKKATESTRNHQPEPKSSQPSTDHDHASGNDQHTEHNWASDTSWAKKSNIAAEPSHTSNVDQETEPVSKQPPATSASKQKKEKENHAQKFDSSQCEVQENWSEISLMKAKQAKKVHRVRPHKAPGIGSVLEVLCTHIESCSCFYVHLNVPTDIGKMSTELTDYYTQYGRPLSIDEMHVGKYVCARSQEDDQFYRATIHNEPTDDAVCVFYVDFGNTETIPLDQVYPLVEQFLKNCSFILKCALDGVYKESEASWEEAIQTLWSLTINKDGDSLPIFLKVTDSQDDLCTVEMYRDVNLMQSVNHILVEKNLITDVTKLTEPDELSFPQTSRWPVMITTVNSARCVTAYIEHGDYSGKRIVLERRLADESCKATYEPHVGDVCAANLKEEVSSEDDWYRVKITELDNDEKVATVLLLDHGYSDSVPQSCLKAFRQHLNALPYQAFQIQLKGITYEHYESIQTHLETFQGKKLEIEPQACEGTTVYGVLWDGKENVNLQLASKISISDQVPTLPRPMSCITVNITCVDNSSGIIYLQVQDDALLTLLEMEANLSDAINKMSSEELQYHVAKSVRVNKLYACQYQEDSWCRVKVIATKHDQVLVRHVDYYTTEVVTNKDLVMLDAIQPDLLQLPPQYIKGQLAGLPPKGQFWTSRATEFLSNAITETTIVRLEVLRHKQDVCVGLLYLEEPGTSEEIEVMDAMTKEGGLFSDVREEEDLCAQFEESVMFVKETHRDTDVTSPIVISSDEEANDRRITVNTESQDLRVSVTNTHSNVPVSLSTTQRPAVIGGNDPAVQSPEPAIAESSLAAVTSTEEVIDSWFSLSKVSETAATAPPPPHLPVTQPLLPTTSLPSKQTCVISSSVAQTQAQAYLPPPVPQLTQTQMYTQPQVQPYAQAAVSYTQPAAHLHTQPHSVYTQQQHQLQAAYAQAYAQQKHLLNHHQFYTPNTQLPAVSANQARLYWAMQAQSGATATIATSVMPQPTTTTAVLQPQMQPVAASASRQPAAQTHHTSKPTQKQADVPPFLSDVSPFVADSTNINDKQVTREINNPMSIGEQGSGVLPTERIQLQAGDVISISDAVDPHDFNCRALHSVDDFEKLQQEMSDYCDYQTSELPPEKPVIGEIYAHLASNRQWYRVQVVTIHEAVRKVTVLYVDSGESGVAGYGYLCPLRADFKKLPFQNISASLVGVSPKAAFWTMTEMKLFKRLAEGAEFTVTDAKYEHRNNKWCLGLKNSAGQSLEDVFSKNRT